VLYNTIERIYEYVSPKDPVTEEVVEEIMEDEAKHETIFRMLLSKEGLKKLEEAK